MIQPLRDPQAVAAIAAALRSTRGDDVARVMLTDGMTLAALIDSVLVSRIKNSDAVKLVARALASGDFIFTPELGSLWRLKYIYACTGSLDVVDMAIATPHETITSTAIRLRLH
ncbi:hypothetical protein ACVIGB_003391 [Bradyrhizobium sp. USDA 4341]